MPTPPPQPASAWSALRERFPWPERRPEAAPIAWSMDYGGRGLILDAIRRRGVRVILEIGVFLGGSLRQWLAASPDTVAVAVDPWPDLKRIPGNPRFVERHPIGRRHAEQLFRPGGLHDTFLASMWDLRDRVVPVRGTGLELLPTLRELGLRPDLIYVDADKKGAELPRCLELFPDALVGGDDWIWQDGRIFPIREPARELARRQGRVLKAIDNTWLIDDRPWSGFQRRLWCTRLPSTLVHELDARRQRLVGRNSAGTRVSP